MRATLLICVFATGCSSVLGFDDFKDTGDGGPGSDAALPHLDLSGTVTAFPAQTSIVVGAGVDISGRDGQLLTPQVQTGVDGMYSASVPAQNGSYDGFVHLSYGTYLDTYVHFLQPVTVATQADGQLFTLDDIQAMASTALPAVPVNGNTATMFIITDGPGHSVVVSNATVYYFDDTHPDPTIIPGGTATSSNGLAVAFNLTNGDYVPRFMNGLQSRSYTVSPHSVVFVSLQ
ncbi:MAG TPA: hypothetical protein VGM90_00475 [Kofleriaceae bacterium]|jgi:hypothetical protein